MKKFFLGLIFFVGWVLSPFTWWNDVFINIPLSYLLANAIFYVTGLPLSWLVAFSYGLTNFVGLLFMYYGAKSLILSFKDRLKAALVLVIALLLYSSIMIYLKRQGMLLPLGELLKNFFR